MNKVTTVNLNGRAYQIEEAGYEILKTYLDQAAAKLNGNPDKDEIMADFEQAIADKCADYLAPNKNVVTTAEVEAIIAKMGPVDAGTTTEAHAADGENSTTAGADSRTLPKRLFQIRQGAWLTGVCTGIAAYFAIDVTVIRVLFVLLAVITHGFGILLYIILMIVMPIARTDDELAAAHGTRPFNAHDFIEQAKARYADFQKEFGNKPPMPATPDASADREAWRKWKQDMRDWKRQLKQDMRREKQNRRAHHDDWADRYADGMNYAWHHPAAGAGRGFLRFLMGVIFAALFITWIFSLWTLTLHGTILGYGITPGYPLWIPIVFLCALFYVIGTPFRLVAHNARSWHKRPYNFFLDVVESLLFIFAIYLVVYTGRELFPFINEACGILASQIRMLKW